MEFWGLEVKPGQTVKCEPEDERFLHLSQAALGESKKGSDNAVMYVKTDDQKLVIGTLSADKFPQIQFDLVFDKEFELSHTSKTANEEEEEKIIPAPRANGKVEGKENEQKKQGKTDSSASKSKAAVNDDDDDDDSDKKGVHVATPHPAKQASKTPVNDKSKEKSPKSGGGSISCKSCSKTFNSEMALQSHSKAKHPAK
uniref:C2H2-type domain-containing protein n=1 Tax=Oryza barthii TaxID=65489 RepID=A0A0D3GBQ1_9ORYZ